MKKPTIFVAFLSAALLTPGCASTPEDYPSLAIRDVERLTTTMDAPAVQSAPLLPRPNSTGQASIAELTEQAQTAHALFLRTAQSTRNKITQAQGAAIGSENWSKAQISLAELEVTRSDALIALADIDQIYVAASTAGEPLDQIASAQQKVERFVAQENLVISQLAAKLQ